MVGQQPGQPPNGIGLDPDIARKMQQKQAIEQMSMTMYLKIATERLASDDCDLTDFMDMAKQCHDVAQAYFEGIGAITSEIEPDGDIQPS